MSEQTTNPVMTEEQAADFAALQAQAADGQPVTVPGTGEPEKPAVDLQAEIAGAITIVVKTIGPAFPSIRDIYTVETIGAASGAVAAVCDKHGWLQGGVFGEYGEEIGAAVVLIPLAIATNQAIRSDIAAAKAKAGKPVTDAGQINAPGPEQKSVIIGQPIVEGEA